MSKSNSKKSNTRWLIVSIIMLAIPVAGGLSTALYSGGDQLDTAGRVAEYFLWLCLGSAVVSIVCIFKLPGWLKLIPVLGTIVGIIVAIGLRATYWISGIGW